MPLSLTYHDVNEAYCELQVAKGAFCEWEETRNGEALVFPSPVIITNTLPYRRVLFDPIRDANPFFHYMEAIWMLSGEENVDFPAKFAKNIRNYSDDNVTLHGAYGYRWRYAFERDQIDAIIYMLKKDKTTRRAVIGMWDPHLDLERNGKDLPCNTHIYFRYTQGRLDMTVCNRSNDLVWGMLGANFVHMSVLHEYVANSIALTMGSLHQFSNNLHVYKGWEDKFSPEADRWYRTQPNLRRWNWSEDTFDWEEGQTFCEYGLDTDEPYRCRILRDNATPMLLAWNAYKDGDLSLALHEASHIYDDDWRHGCNLWLERRQEGRRETEEG